MKKYNIDKLEEKINKYKNINIKDVNPEDICDIKNIKIDKRKSKEERILDYLTQVENPYVFKINGHLVQIGFSENSNKTAEDCLTNVLKTLYK